MSIFLTLFLTFIAFLAVLVLAASASFPRRPPADMDAPEGDWIGTARLPQGDAKRSASDKHPPARAEKQPLKMHAWI